jgi:hypothetical protein
VSKELTEQRVINLAENQKYNMESKIKRQLGVE